MNQLGITPEITTESVRQLFADVLGTEIRADLSFLAQGGDSFHAVLVVDHVEQLWGIEADFTAVLQSTPAELALLLGAAAGTS
ncbi:phosphopantetheine-binding protein [Streptomyces naphthomycinicus]|uniref:phosphopantetheine-binding protein n=1 Tax=Streptomyces naphthomycinicus TaxID=2872625 RepID=UPI001CEDCAFD|nr:phosphopantetheine-binding protein [Streptomyces sp. TML10]